MNIEIEEAAAILEQKRGRNFVHLIEGFNLNPRTDFRDVELAGLDFTGANLREFSFSGSLLIDCECQKARWGRENIRTAIFFEDSTAFDTGSSAREFAVLSRLESTYLRRIANAFALSITEPTAVTARYLGRSVELESGRSKYSANFNKQVIDLIFSGKRDGELKSKIGQAVRTARYPLDGRRLRAVIREVSELQPEIHSYFDSSDARLLDINPSGLL